MSMGLGVPPHGIPIPPEVHDMYPENVKKAWETFHAWWIKQSKPARRSAMPRNVAEAMKTILEAPIPGHGGATGKDSCYMVGVQAQLEE